MGDTMIDSEARERVSALEMAVWGPQGTNGLKSEVKNLNQTVAHIQTEMRHYVDTRPETCLGLKALADHEAAEGKLYEEGQEEDTNMKIAAMNGRVEEKKMKWQVAAALITAAFLFAGQVVTTAQASATQRDLAALTHTLEARK